MEDDDMHATWERYSARLDAALRLNAAAARTIMAAGAAHALDRVRRNLTIEIALDAVLALVLGALAVDRVPDIASVALLGILAAYAIVILACAIAQYVALAQVSVDMPAVAAATALERFRLIRARATLWTLALAPLMWVPIAIVVFAGGRPALVNTPWLWANVALGVAVACAGALAGRRLERGGADAPLRRVADTLSGNSVRKARAALAALERYETETAAE